MACAIKKNHKFDYILDSDPGPKTFFFSGEMYVDQSESIFWEGCRKYGGSPGFMMNDDDISNVKNTLGQGKRGVIEDF